MFSAKGPPYFLHTPSAARASKSLGSLHGFPALTVSPFRPVMIGKSSDSSLVHELQIIQKAASDGAGTVRRIKEFSRSISYLDASSVSVSDIVDDCLQLTRLRWKDEAVALTVTEFWMMHALARYPGHVKNRQQLMDAAQAVLDDNTITSHIKRIRRKFVAIDPEFSAIETAYGMGYRWLSD